MSDIEIFEHEDFGEIRALVIEGQPHWVAKDVCDILGYSNHNGTLKRLDEDEKGVNSIDTPGGRQNMAVINEAGLYNLVLGSKKKIAKPFKRWVTHEVIPSIRKTGSYSVDEPKDDLAMVENLNQQLTHVVSHIRKQQEQIAANQKEVSTVKEEVQEIKDKVNVVKEHDDVTASDIARRLGLTTVNGTAHNQLIGAIAKKLEMETDYKHRFSNEDIKIIPRAEGGFQVYYKPEAAQKIYEWFNDHKDAIYYEKYYKRSGKYGDKGELREKGYTVRGTNYKIWSAKESKEAV